MLLWQHVRYHRIPPKPRSSLRLKPTKSEPLWFGRKHVSLERWFLTSCTSQERFQYHWLQRHLWDTNSSSFPHRTTLYWTYLDIHGFHWQWFDLDVVSLCTVALTAWIQSGCNFPGGLRPPSSDPLSSGNKLPSSLRGLNSRSRVNTTYLIHILRVYEEVDEREIALCFLLVLWPVSFVCTEILITQQGYKKVFTSKLISMKGGSCCLWIRK